MLSVSLLVRMNCSQRCVLIRKSSLIVCSSNYWARGLLPEPKISSSSEAYLVPGLLRRELKYSHQQWQPVIFRHQFLPLQQDMSSQEPTYCQRKLRLRSVLHPFSIYSPPQLASDVLQPLSYPSHQAHLFVSA